MPENMDFFLSIGKAISVIAERVLGLTRQDYLYIDRERGVKFPNGYIRSIWVDNRQLRKIQILALPNKVHNFAIVQWFFLPILLW